MKLFSYVLNVALIMSGFIALHFFVTHADSSYTIICGIIFFAFGMVRLLLYAPYMDE